MDYYSALGVTKSATAEEIKKAYRALAMKHHPDRNPDDPKAEVRLKDINEAYGVLSDPQKRSSFDRFGVRDRSSVPPQGFDIRDIFRNAHFHGQGGRNPNAPQRGADINIKFPVTLSAAVLGAKEHIDVQITDSCDGCSGNGATKFDTCELCKGSGVTQFVQNNMQMSVSCRSCGGMGRFALDVCGKCNGAKAIPVVRSLDVTIPAGVMHGQRLALRGQGQSGVNSGPRGDAYIVILLAYPTDLSPEEQEFLRGLDAKTK